MVIWLIVIVFIGLFLFGVTRFKDVHVKYSVDIEEDDPRWDCRTMGNGVCGNG
jgi:hypothetical protein